MKLLRHMVPHQKPYKIIPTRNIVFSFNHLGYKTIEDYANEHLFCFDNLGVEPMGRHYGKDCNVMGEILLSRYDVFCNTEDNGQGQIDLSTPNISKRNIITHATTNLNAQELETLYGNRVRSRMRQLFNLIAFDRGSKDKRV